MEDEKLLPVRGEVGIAGLVPFGVGQAPTHPFLDALSSLQENADSAGYAWRILKQGVCGECALGPRGLSDDVLPGPHLCAKRLRLLRQHTRSAFEPSDIDHIDRLRRKSPEELRSLGRIPYPFLYQAGSKGFARLSWDDALETAAGFLRSTPPEGSAWLAGDTGIANETYYAFVKTVRELGSSNIDLCTSSSFRATQAGLKATIGTAHATCSLTDWIGTDLLLLWGTDLANEQPVSARYLAAAKQRGTRVVVINPELPPGNDANWIPTQLGSALFGTRLMDDFIQVKAGGDLALLRAVMKILIAKDAVSHDFLDAHTTGWDTLSTRLEGSSLRELAKSAGVPMGEIEWLAELIGRSNNLISVWSEGLSQQGPATVAALAELHLSQGAIGRPLNGLMPMPRHPGVQAARICGVEPGEGQGADHFLQAANDGKLHLLYALKANLTPLANTPEHLAASLQNVRFRIHQGTTLDPSMLQEPGEAVLVLPEQSPFEQRGGGTSISVERRIRFSPEISDHPVLGETRPPWEIPTLIAITAHPELEPSLKFTTSQALRTEMADEIELFAGLQDLNKEGEQLQWGGPHLCVQGVFPNLPEQRAQLGPVFP